MSLEDKQNRTEILVPSEDLKNASVLGDMTMSKLLRQIRGDVEPIFMSFHLVFCVLSMMVGLLNVLILSRRSMRKVSMNVLLLSLELSNMIFALVYLPVCVIRFVDPAAMLESKYAYVSRFIYIPVSACVTFNVWITVIIGAWRCLGVASPLTAGQRLTRTRALVVVLVLACLCSLSSAASNVLTTQVKRQDFYVFTASGNMSRRVSIFITVKSDVVEADPSILSKLNVSLTICFFVLPSICLVMVNSFLGCRLCMGYSAELREGQTAPPGGVPSVRTTAILMALTSVFLVGNASAYLPEFVRYFWPDKLTKRQWPFYYPWNYIFNTFILGFVINSLSFCGYYCMSSRFRDSTHELFGVRTDRLSRNTNFTGR